MSLNTIQYQLMSTSRADVRKEMLQLFSDELPGTGAGDHSSKYRYCVDTYEDYQIVLARPAPLNKGLDFIVRIDGLFFKKNRRYNNPGHSDIINALTYVKEHLTETNYDIIKEELNHLLFENQCSIEKTKSYYFLDYEGNEHPIAIILLAAKWLFIEQDMTYWNWSGRYMLWNALKEANLV
ncbi:MAG: hypothetical protein RR305_19875 [Chryseobacterium sp.]